ncbi:MAG: sodium-dependent transporter [Bacteroidaceae bacterium]|nr:sodium-dependent transporter [Bacteroidaceae bacterium]
MRESFGSKLGAFAALAGSTIGLGNMWRFPYLMTENGGGSFILIYILVSVFFSLPLFTLEMIIGRRGRASTAISMQKISGSKKWNWFSIIGIFVPLCMFSFYVVVGGWTVRYCVESFSFGFDGMTSVAQSGAFFAGFVGNNASNLVYTLTFLFFSLIITALGVSKGIERFTRPMMLLMIVLMVLVVIRSVTLPGAGDGLKYLFVPDLSKVSMKTVFIAMGQSFMSMSVGIGAIVVYASYVKKEDSLLRYSVLTCVSDTGFALLSGIAIVPAIYYAAHVGGYEPTMQSGPGLVFEMLPVVFNAMPAGNIIAILFFFSLFVAALTSAISLVETVNSVYMDMLGISRKKAVVYTFLSSIVFVVLSSLSFGALKDIKIIGRTFFDLFDNSTNSVLPISALIICIFAGKYIKKAIIRDEMSSEGTIKVNEFLVKFLSTLTRSLLPLFLIAMIVAWIMGIS